MEITSQIRRRRYGGIATIVGALFGAQKLNGHRVRVFGLRSLRKPTFAQHNYESDRNGLGELRKGIAIAKSLAIPFRNTAKRAQISLS